MGAAVKLFIILQILFRVSNGEYFFQTGSYEVPVDHFSFTTNATFQMKFLYNDTWWNKAQSGPIFFYTGNEGSIELFAQNSGFMWDIAGEFGALLLFAEHRYYGSSLPFGNESFSTPEKSGYLTSEQALADFAEFLQYYRFHFGNGKNAIIAFGGSYGGMLTAWMRMKYPHVIQGGIAASAPIAQFTGLTDCEQFGKIVTADFEKESTECVESIRKSWTYINELGDTATGRNWLSTNWKLCSPLQSKDDIKKVKDWLSNIYTNLAMVDYPYASGFLEPLPAYPIKAFCEKLLDSKLPDKLLLRSLFKGLNLYFNYTGSTQCLDIATQATGSLDDKGWDYQACTEMVMPMCYNGKDDFFEPQKWDYTEYATSCVKKWGVQPRPWMAEIIYGGRNINAASNLVFSNGLLDPWSSGGIIQNVSASVLAIIIPEGAHHLDLRGSDPDDPVSVKWARNFEKYQIKKWIKDYSKSFEAKGKENEQMETNPEKVLDQGTKILR